MSFTPVLPPSGLGGWRFLNATMERQRATHDAAPALERDLDHFRARIGEVRTAEDLVSDRRLLGVALTAFGLEDDLPSRALIRQVLEGGTDDPKSLANRLADKRYRDLSSAFGLDGRPVPETARPDFADMVAERYKARSFELAVGVQDDSMRLAMNARRELSELAASGSSDEVKWLRIMGTPPLREVLENVLGLPKSFGTLSLDRQMSEFRARAGATLGASTVSEIASPEKLPALLDRFMLLKGMNNPSSGPLSPAATIMAGMLARM